MEKKSLLLLQACVQFGVLYDDAFNPYHRERTKRQDEERLKKKRANMKRIAEINKRRFGERPLSRFVIKGHEIEACSRKDAIVKLRHKGLL